MPWYGLLVLNVLLNTNQPFPKTERNAPHYLRRSSNFFFYSVLHWSVAVSQMRQCSVGQGLSPLYEARCGWVFLTVASNLEAAPGSPQRQHGGGPLVVSCGQYVQRAANVSQWPDGREDGIRWLLVQWPHLKHSAMLCSTFNLQVWCSQCWNLHYLQRGRTPNLTPARANRPFKSWWFRSAEWI